MRILKKWQDCTRCVNNFSYITTRTSNLKKYRTRMYSEIFKIIPQTAHSSPPTIWKGSKTAGLTMCEFWHLMFYSSPIRSPWHLAYNRGSIALCYNSRAHCPLLQCLNTTSAILGGAHSYFVISSSKCEGKNSFHYFI